MVNSISLREMDRDSWPKIIGLDEQEVGWNDRLSADDEELLEHLMGVALLDPTIAQRLLRHDLILFEDFHLSSRVQSYLLTVQADTLTEFAENLLSKLSPRRPVGHPGTSVIQITPERVKQVADAMRRANAPPHLASLQSLYLIDEFLNGPGWPFQVMNRDLALQYLLSQLITHEFAHRCRIFGIPVPDMDESLEAAQQTIFRIAQQHRPHLRGWAWLYYSYVRVDLETLLTMFTETASIDERTQRRDREMAIQQLTQKLIVLEYQARLRRVTHAAEE